jgi:hypothetical protein
MAYEVQSLAIAEPHVGEAKMVALALQPFLRLGDRADRIDAEAHLRQGELEQLADVGLVVDDQNLGRARCHAPFGAPHGTTCRQRMRKCAPAVSFTYSSAARLAAQSSRAM